MRLATCAWRHNSKFVLSKTGKGPTRSGSKKQAEKSQKGKAGRVPIAITFGLAAMIVALFAN